MTSIDSVSGGSPRVAELAAGFRAAWTDADDPITATTELLPLRLVRACAAVLPVDGAGLSLMDDDVRIPLAGSDAAATLAERLQFTMGEGPCLSAAQTSRTVAADEHTWASAWPGYAEQMATRTDYRAVISVPFAIGPHADAVLDLYLCDARRINDISLVQAAVVVDEIARTLLSASSPDNDDPAQDGLPPVPAWVRTTAARERTQVWVAGGIVMVRFDATVEDAMAMLRAHAYELDTTVDALAKQIVDGTVDPEVLR